jgi:hypothetical protein
VLFCLGFSCFSFCPWLERYFGVLERWWKESQRPEEATERRFVLLLRFISLGKKRKK